MSWCLGAALATTVAGYLRRPDPWLVLRLRLGVRSPAMARRSSTRLRMAAAVAATSAAVLAIDGRPTQVALAAGVGAVLFGLALRRRAIERGRADAFRGDVARVLTAVVSELRAGVEPASAMHSAVADLGTPGWKPVRAASGFDVVQALRVVSSHPGGDALAEVAAAWHLADQTGSPLATVLDRMAASVRAEVELAREVAVEAAPARATASLMALLPLAGLGLGTLLGVNPLRVLLTSAIGVACLIVGFVLACLGLWRVERIVAEVEQA